MNYYIICLIFLMQVVFPPFCMSQESERQEISILAQSDLLNNGRFYYKDYPSASGNPYYDTDKWMKGWVSIEGVIFYGVEIKLDIVSDKLILNTNTRDIIELNPQLIDSFRVNNGLFIRDNSMTLSKKYLEKVYAGNASLFKLHHKEFIKEFNSFTPYGKISEIATSRFLFKDGVDAKVNTKRDFINVYPEKKKEIKTFLKKNNIKYRKATNDELKKLMVFCESLKF